MLYMSCCICHAVYMSSCIYVKLSLLPSVVFGLKNVGGRAFSISSDIPDKSPFFNFLLISRSFCDL